MKSKKLEAAINAVLILIVFLVGNICLWKTEVKTSGVAYENVYYNGNKQSDKVSLMFNVYWGTDEVYRILNILDKFGGKSTFFVGGTWADDNTVALTEIYKRGHEIGNHGYFHKDHDKLTYEQNVEEITLLERLVYSATGVKTRLFAPPSGAYDGEVASVCAHLGYKVIMWSRDTIDWRDKDKNLTFKRATEGIGGGDFVLMHPMSETVAALESILTYYADNNLKAVTVTDNLVD